MADPWLEGSNATPVDQGANWTDYPLALTGGVSQLLSDQGAGLRALGEEADPDEKALKATGYLGQAIQEAFKEARDWSEGNMSDEGKRRIQATMTDPDFWTLGGMTMKGLNMAPSIAAVAVPSYLLSGLGLGAAATAAVGGELSATSLINEMYARTDAMSDAELQKEVPLYKDMRLNDTSEEDARRELNRVQRGLRPLYAAGVGAIANTIGVGGQVARGLSGKAGSILAEEGEGLLKRTAKGALEGSVSEAADEGTTDYLGQEGAVEGGLQEGIDYAQTGISAAIEPAISQTTPPTTATPEVATTAIPDPAASGVVPPTGPDAAQTLAIVGEQAPQVPTPEVAPAPVTPEVTPPPVTTPEPVARAPEPVTTPEAPPVEPVTTPEAPVARAPEPVRTPEVPSVPPVESEARGPVTTPPGPRVLADVSPEGRQAAADAKRAWGNQLKKNMEEPTEDVTSQGKNFTKAEKATREAIRTGTKAITDKYPPAQEEVNLYSRKPAEVVSARNRI